MTRLIKGVRDVEAALGDGIKKPAPCEAETASVARKSLVAARDLTPGTPLSEALISIKRPGTGLPPSFLPFMYGRVARVPIVKDALLRLEDFQ
jgi:sialic acid synthase SpsE